MGLQWKRHLLDSVKQHGRETIFLLSGLTQLQVFENRCGAYAEGSCHTFNVVKEHCGEATFQLPSRSSQNGLKTYEKPNG